MKPIKSYVIHAVYDWALDNGLTPHILVDADTNGTWFPYELPSTGPAFRLSLIL